MFQKILVPLDGSKLAECALPYAEELAKGKSEAEVILASVTERVTGLTRGTIHRKLSEASDLPGLEEVSSEKEVTFGKKEKQAQDYLNNIARQMETRGIKVKTEVLLGNPAEEITDFARYNNIDVIVMSSHGHSGPSRWASGSVTDRVFRSSCVPMLIVRAPGCIPGF